MYVIVVYDIFKICVNGINMTGLCLKKIFLIA